MRRCVFVALFFCCAAQALELGEPLVENAPGETLDVSIPLLGVGETERALRLVGADRAAYAAAGIEYTPLHERLVLELVAGESPPRVAVSSIGPVYETAFDLVVGIAGAAGASFKPVRVVLKTPPPPAPRIMTPPAVLARLLSLLADERGLSRTAAFTELKSLVGGRRGRPGRPYREGDKRLVIGFGRNDFDPAFVGGVEALLGDAAGALFRRRVAQGRGAYALSEALFGDAEYAVLARLLTAGTVSAMREGEGAAQRLRRLDEKVAALENRIVELGYLLERGAREPQAAPRARWWERAASLLADYGWHNRRLLSRPTWIGVAVFWGLLLLLLAARQWRRSRAAVRGDAAGTPERSPVTLEPGVLPGQKELERTRAGADADPVAGQLHLAYAYIEIGESEKASSLLDEVVRNGNAEQIERARSLQGKLG